MLKYITYDRRKMFHSVSSIRELERKFSLYNFSINLWVFFTNPSGLFSEKCVKSVSHSSFPNWTQRQAFSQVIAPYYCCSGSFHPLQTCSSKQWIIKHIKDLPSFRYANTSSFSLWIQASKKRNCWKLLIIQNANEQWLTIY